MFGSLSVGLFSSPPVSCFNLLDLMLYSVIAFSNCFIRNVPTPKLVNKFNYIKHLFYEQPLFRLLTLTYLCPCDPQMTSSRRWVLSRVRPRLRGRAPRPVSTDPD